MKNYDKPRITSTVLLGIFLTIFLIFVCSTISINWADVQQEANQAAEQTEGAGAVAAAGAVALVLALGIIFLIGAYIVIFLLCIPCLIFSIKNRHSSLKPIRIISYVYDGVYIALMLAMLIRSVLLFNGI